MHTFVTKPNPRLITTVKKIMVDDVMANLSAVGLRTRRIKPDVIQRTVNEYMIATVSRESFRTFTFSFRMSKAHTKAAIWRTIL